MRTLSKKLYWGLAVMATGLIFGLAPSIFAGPINLGSAADYTVVGVGGSASVQSEFEIYQSDTVINGNVAEGPYTTLTHEIDATVNGRWDYDLTDVNPLVAYPGSNTPSGGFHQIDLSGVSADARAASTAAAAFAPTQTFASLDAFDGVGSIVGNGGLNVIRITGDSALKISLTLQGTAADSWIFQFTSSGKDVLKLSGMTMNIGAINPDNIYWNFDDLGGDITINAMDTDQIVYGNFLAPDRNLTGDHAIVDGRLIAGGSGTLLSIHSSSQVIPEPGTTLLLVIGTALVGLARFVRRQFA
jgi:choice-of-anchor A domain-containing protein